MEDEYFIMHQLGHFADANCLCIPTQIYRQATSAFGSTETGDSAPSSFQNAVISYLSEDITAVGEIFPEDQSIWSVLLMIFSSPNPLRYGKRCVPYSCRVFIKKSDWGYEKIFFYGLHFKSCITILGHTSPVGRG